MSDVHNVFEIEKGKMAIPTVTLQMQWVFSPEETGRHPSITRLFHGGRTPKLAFLDVKSRSKGSVMFLSLFQYRIAQTNSFSGP